jgi:hypothetical protein
VLLLLLSLTQAQHKHNTCPLLRRVVIVKCNTTQHNHNKSTTQARCCFRLLLLLRTTQAQNKHNTNPLLWWVVVDNYNTSTTQAQQKHNTSPLLFRVLAGAKHNTSTTQAQHKPVALAGCYC